MNELFKTIYKDLSFEAIKLLESVDAILKESIPEGLEEKVWSKMPMYYLGDRTIILALFNDHINIASNPAIYKKSMTGNNAILAYQEDLKAYKITPKGMLQIYTKEDIPKDILIKIFNETFKGV